MSKIPKDNFYKKHIIPFKEFLEKETLNVLKSRGKITNLKLTDEELNLLKNIRNRKDDNYFKITIEELDKVYSGLGIENEKDLNEIELSLCKKVVDASVAKNILISFCIKYFKNISLKKLKEIVQDNIWIGKRLINNPKEKILVNPVKKELMIVDQDKKTLYSIYAESLTRYFIEDLDEDLYYSSELISNGNKFDKINDIFQEHSEGLMAYLFLKSQLFLNPKRFLYSKDYRVADKALEFISIPQSVKVLEESPELYSVISKKIDKFSYEPGPISKEELDMIKDIKLPAASGRKVFGAVPKKSRTKFLLDISYKYLEVYKDYRQYNMWTYKRDCIEAADNIIRFFLCKINKKHMHMFMFLASIPSLQTVIRDKVNV